MFVYIGGVNGAGKTTLIKKVVEIAKRAFTYAMLA